MTAPVLAGTNAAEAQAKALEALKKQQAAALKAAQEAAKKAQQEAAARAAAIAAAQRAAQAAAQKAAQEAARRAAQEAAAQAAAQRAAQAAAQKAAQEAAKRAAQEAAAQAAAQKAAQAAAQKAAQAAAQKAAQEAAARAAQQKAAQQPAARTPTPAATSQPAQSQTAARTPTAVPQVQSPAAAAPKTPAVAPAVTPAVSTPPGGSPAPAASVTEPVAASDDDDKIREKRARDASHLDGVTQFSPGDFLKTEKEVSAGTGKPDWAPDPSVLSAPRPSSSIKHAEPAEELAKALKLTGRDANGGTKPPAPPPAASTPETPASPPPPVASAPSKDPVAAPIKTGSVAGAAPTLPPLPHGEEILATGLTDKQVKVLDQLGVSTETVTMPSTGTSVQRIRVPTGMNPDQLKAALTKQMPLTPFVPNHRFIIFGGAAGDAAREDGPAQSSCEGGACFGPELVHWSSTLQACTKDVKVGIIDTSFDTSHPAFRSLKASHGQFLNGQKPSALDWHGTAVLSELAGHPESGTPGLIPHAHFFLAAAFLTDETGNASTDTVRLLSALEWMEALGVQYINMSFTGPRDDLIEAAIRRMRKKGVVFIAAAGNHGPNAPPSYPAAYAEVIAVTAINRKGESYRSANRGSYIDVSAPGVDIPAALPNGKQGLRTGTSFAAPFVTAILAARMPRWQAAIDKGDVLTAVNIADLGPPGRDPIYGAGLALAPQQCGGEPAGGVAARPPSETDDQAAVPLDRPALGAFTPASGLGFR